MYADEALVIDVRSYEVLIRYIAWDHSFDEWVSRSSARLAERGTRLLAHMSAKDVLGMFVPGTHFAALSSNYGGFGTFVLFVRIWYFRVGSLCRASLF